MQLIKYIFRVAYNPRHQNGVSKPRFSAPAQIQFSIRHLPPGFQMPRSRKCHVVEMQTYFGYVTVFSTRKYICAPRQLSTCWLLEDQVLQQEQEDARDKKSQWEPLVSAIVVIFSIIVLSSYSPLALDSCFFCLLLIRSEASWTGLFSTFGLTSFPSSISQKHMCQDGGINGWYVHGF